ncbi:MAG: serine/threonine-protein kinase [Thermoguttaceae bacterium]|jgi:serine/threonine protein kinase
MAKSALGYLGPYRLLNVVHTGQSSQIWQAMDDGRQQMVAVKTLNEKCPKDAEHIGNLRREYNVCRTLVDPRIIQVYAFGVDRGMPYLATEWFPTPNLKRRIRSKEEREKIAHLIPKIIEEAAGGLGFAHQRGWVHRDIKPDNFLADDEGRVKLIDFGLARRARHGLLARLLSPRWPRQGTPSYMSPEQIRRGPLDERSDVYSFGCTVYELIAGTLPFTGTTLEELFGRHLKAAIPSLEAADRNVTPEFGQLVRRCLAKDPSARPASAREFLGELRLMRVFRTLPGRAYPTGN